MLVDTSGLLCLFHRDEHQHREAVDLFAEASRRLTHNYVLAEFVPLAQVRGLSRSLTLSFSKHLLIDEQVEVVWVDERLHQQALDLLQARQDKTYSLCDAISFLLMRERGISTALTDGHFSQEGFTRLLQS
jgi:predicted nucleic acid-binding protein